MTIEVRALGPDDLEGAPRPASHRPAGVADVLIRSALEWAASSGLRGVNLEVAPGNPRAERVYARHGFVRTVEQPMIEGGPVMRFRVVTSDVDGVPSAGR
jgi:hypothetical protein